jgi:hypothetical protein
VKPLSTWRQQGYCMQQNTTHGHSRPGPGVPGPVTEFFSFRYRPAQESTAQHNTVAKHALSCSALHIQHITTHSKGLSAAAVHASSQAFLRWSAHVTLQVHCCNSVTTQGRACLHPEDACAHILGESQLRGMHALTSWVSYNSGGWHACPPVTVASSCLSHQQRDGQPFSYNLPALASSSHFE